jgi:hypothetical protein
MLLRLVAAFAAAATAVTSAYAATTLKDCGVGTSLFHLDAAKLDPADPAPGAPVDLTLSYTVPAGVTIHEGTAEYDVTVNYIPLSPYTEPLCQDVPCPIKPGSYTNTTRSTWPSGVHGLVVNKMIWKGTGTSDAATLLCLQITTKFALRAER